MKKIILIFLGAFLMTSTHASTGLEEIFGNAENGDSCLSDYQCGSLCCDKVSEMCLPHNPEGDVYCSKPVGESCITNEFCKSEYVVTCRLVKIGTNADGGVACAIRCPAVLTHGSCINATCKAPITPPVPTWDGVNCTGAVDP